MPTVTTSCSPGWWRQLPSDFSSPLFPLPTPAHSVLVTMQNSNLVCCHTSSFLLMITSCLYASSSRLGSIKWQTTLLMTCPAASYKSSDSLTSSILQRSKPDPTSSWFSYLETLTPEMPTTAIPTRQSSISPSILYYTWLLWGSFQDLPLWTDSHLLCDICGWCVHSWYCVISSVSVSYLCPNLSLEIQL